MLPLAHRAESWKKPLQKGPGKSFMSRWNQTNTTTVDFLLITNHSSETRQALLILENAKQQAAARLQLGAAVRARCMPISSLSITRRTQPAVDEWAPCQTTASGGRTRRIRQLPGTHCRG